MERRIYEAAVEGSVFSLRKLLQEDPLALDRFMVECYIETPLHVASMLGHVDFVREIINIKPELARELGSRNSSPLHLATAKGYLDIVKILVGVNPDTCQVRDQHGRNPLHIAAIKGHVHVLRELVSKRPHAALVPMERGEMILHACVRYNRLEAMEFLVESIKNHEFLNSKDGNGNTILHLLAIDKQVQGIKFLTTNTTIEVNAMNANGLTAYDISTQSKRDVRDWEIEALLRDAGAIRAKDVLSSSTPQSGVSHNEPPTLTKGANNQITILHLRVDELQKIMNTKENWVEKKRGALMVVASLIATMAFQVGVNPPGGVWQENEPDSFDYETYYVGTSKPGTSKPGTSIAVETQSFNYDVLMVSNTIGFVASLSIIILLISGLPTKSNVLIWILMVIMWAAVSAMTIAYLFSVHITCNTANSDSIFAKRIGVPIVIFIWIGFLTIILLSHIIRLIVRLIKFICKSYRRRRTPSTSTV